MLKLFILNEFVFVFCMFMNDWVFKLVIVGLGDVVVVCNVK